MASIAAVILSYNAFPSLTELINVVKQQSIKVDHIYLVDNASDPVAWQLFESKVEGVETIRFEKNMGVGHGHNAGWRKVLDRQFDFVWALEHDCIPDNKCLENLIKAYTNYTDPSVIGGIHPLESGTYDLSEFDYYRIKGLRLKKIRNYSLEGDPAMGFGTSFNGTLFPVSTIKSIGYLREDFFVGLEDNEFSQRMNKHGLKILRVPAASVRHDLLKNSNSIGYGRKRLVWSRTSPLRKYYVMRNSLFMSRNNLYFDKGKNRLNLLYYVCRLPFTCLLDMVTSLQGYKLVICRLAALTDAVRSKMGPRDYWFLK